MIRYNLFFSPVANGEGISRGLNSPLWAEESAADYEQIRRDCGLRS